ncbi:MAG: 3-hydroxyisobutyryl-CoA hydrolase [Galactobacter sp.]
MNPHLAVEIHSGLGIITLNRPEKINALTPGMVSEIGATLRAWRYAPEVNAVVLRGAGERGFCAGGDLTDFHRAQSGGDQGGFLDILVEQFELAALVGTYPKPIMSIMSGLALGAGLGMAGVASIRVVTPDARLGMPETRIGYSPDAGGSLLLGRAPGRLGEHLAATGDTIGAGDAVEAGLADFCVAAETQEDLISSFADLATLRAGEVSIGLEVMHGTRPPAPAAARERAWMDHCYAAEDLPAILTELESSPWPAARAAAERIRRNSPLAVATALEVVRAARDEDELRGSLEREHRAAAFLMDHPDVAEGIRARIVDKDDAPRWDPAAPEDVDRDLIIDALYAEEDDAHGEFELG